MGPRRCVTQIRQARRCKGRKSDGSPCRAYAMEGAMVCASHGGRAPQVRAAAAERLLQEQAAKELAKFSGAPPVDDPLSALAHYLGEAQEWAAACERRVEELKAVRFESKLGIEQLRSEIGMYERACQRRDALAVAMSKLAIDARISMIQARDAAKIVEGWQAACDAAGLDGEQRERGQAAFTGHLRLVPEVA